MSENDAASGMGEAKEGPLSHKEAKIEAAAAKARAKAARPIYLKKRVLIPAAVVVIAVIGSLADGDSGTTSSSSPAPSTSSSAATPAPTTPPATTPAPSTSSLTRSQQNAIRAAEDYLRFTAFSRTGLIAQLEFEGYSKDDATFAVDNIVVDWKEQAARSAESYLSFTAFSRSGLIDQLVFEGFTREEAVYGVDQAGL